MVGFNIDGLDQMMGDNESLVTSCYINSSTPKKKHNAIDYHRVREAVHEGVIILENIPERYNPDYLLTNTLGT